MALVEPGRKAPAFTLLDQDGKSVTLSKSVKAKKAPRKKP